MKKLLLLSFSLLLTKVSLTAQVGWKCETHTSALPFAGPLQLKAQIEAEQDTATLYIPVTVNIIGKDDGSGYFEAVKLMEALCRLQTDFDQHGFHFYLENLRYINSSAFYNMSATFYGSVDMYQFITDHNSANTMNLYVVQSAQGSAFVSILPDDFTNPLYPPVIYNGLKHALVIPKAWLGNDDHTITHEAGHYFGLWHTFNGWETISYLPYAGSPAPDSITRSGEVAGVFYTLTVPVERTGGVNCAGTADYFCDTPPDYLSIGFTCNANHESDLVQTDPSGNTFRSDGTFYMSYSNNACQNRFSNEQANWMRAVAQGTRNYLLFNQTQPAPFSPPVWEMVYPPDGETVAISDSITLEWEDIPGADFTLLEFGLILGANLHAPLFKDILPNENTFKVRVSPQRNYYWIVKAVNRYYPCEVVADTSYFSTTQPSAAHEKHQDALLQMYPNPVSSRVYWRLPEMTANLQTLNVQLFNAQGMLVQQQLTSEQSLDMQGLPPGLYTLQVLTDGRVYTGKIVKQ